MQYAGRMRAFRPIRTWESGPRLAAGGFALLVLGFALLAQANLFVQDGGGALPGPQAVLEKYHGRPGASVLHDVLSRERHPGADDPRNMWQYLGSDDATIDAYAERVLNWVDEGAPESEWEAISMIVASPDRCAACHAPGELMETMPFQTYEEILPYAQAGEGMPLGRLLISAHNHLFGFAVLALLLALLFCATRLGGRLRIPILVAAFLGPALDIGGWFLTRSVGAPFQYMVMAGGALFGIATTLMALAVLAEALGLGPAAPDTSP